MAGRGLRERELTYAPTGQLHLPEWLPSRYGSRPSATRRLQMARLLRGVWPTNSARLSMEISLVLTSRLHHRTGHFEIAMRHRLSARADASAGITGGYDASPPTARIAG